MSHKAYAEIEVYDPQAVEDTLEELGVEYQKAGTWTGYFGGNRTDVDYLIAKQVIDEAAMNYGIGVSQTDDGKLLIITESMQNGTCSDLQARFMSTYKRNATLRKFKEYGYRVVSKGNGEYELVATRETKRKLHGRWSQAQESNQPQRRQIRLGR